MRLLLIALSLSSILFGVTSIRGREPLTLLCLERLNLLGQVAQLAILPTFERLVEGMATLNRIEHSGNSDASIWNTATWTFEEPVLALEADAVMTQILEDPRTSESNRELLGQVQQRVRQKIIQRIVGYAGKYTLQSIPRVDLTPEEVQEKAKFILAQTNTIDEIQVRNKVIQEIQLLAKTKSFEATYEVFKWGPAIIAVYDTSQFPTISMMMRFTMASLYLRCLMEFKDPNPNDAMALAMLEFGSGGSPKDLLRDVEAMQKGVSPHALWLNQISRYDEPETTSRPLILARARLSEMMQGVYGGTAIQNVIPIEHTWQTVHKIPIKLPDGTLLPRKLSEKDAGLFFMVARFFVDRRLEDDEGIWAVLNIAKLLGDPRVDAASLEEWAVSVLGERNNFDDKQVLRFIQEATAVAGVVDRLSLDKKVFMSREFRRDHREELGSSFDFTVAYAETREVVEAVEIKQMTRFAKASDLGGIIRQATDKLDGPFVAQDAEDTSQPIFVFEKNPPTLRSLRGRHTLVIQVPWSDTITYKAGAVTIVTRLNGQVEHWRESRTGKILFKTEDMFIQMARHLSQLPNAEYFDEIQLTDTRGKAIVTFFNQRDRSDGAWRIQYAFPPVPENRP